MQRLLHHQKGFTCLSQLRGISGRPNLSLYGVSAGFCIFYQLPLVVGKTDQSTDSTEHRLLAGDTLQKLLRDSAEGVNLWKFLLACCWKFLHLEMTWTLETMLLVFSVAPTRNAD